MSDEDLDTETLIFRQIDRVMRTASFDAESYDAGVQGQTSMRVDTETWSKKVIMSAYFLDSFLAPLKDDEDEEYVKETKKEYQERFPDSFGEMAMAQGIFQANIEILHDKNIVYDQSASFVLEDADTDTIMEDGEDGMSEEVV